MTHETLAATANLIEMLAWITVVFLGVTQVDHVLQFFRPLRPGDMHVVELPQRPGRRPAVCVGTPTDMPGGRRAA